MDKDTRQWLNDWLREHGMTTVKQMSRADIEAAMNDYTDDVAEDALLDACKAVCEYCEQGKAVEAYTPPGSDKVFYRHPGVKQYTNPYTGDVELSSDWCKAQFIRRLMRQGEA